MSNVKFIYKNFPFITDIYDEMKKKMRFNQSHRYRSTTAWVKATPGASLIKDGKYQKIILQSIPNVNDTDEYKNTTLYTFNTLYRPDDSYRPVSGISKISVDYKNPFGGVRRAKINWICHSLTELERMTPYYFNIGKTIFLEWGWGTNINYHVSDDGTLRLDNYFEKVQDIIFKSEGQYDAMIGYITNFSYIVNADLSYECTTDIVSIGALMEGISNSNQKFDAGIINKKIDTNGDGVNDAASQTLFKYIKNKLDDDISLLIGTNSMYIDNDRKDIAIYRDIDAGSDNVHTYITWGFVEDKIFKEAGPNLFVNNNQVLKLDSSGIPIRNHPCLRTTDLSICFLPVTNGYKDVDEFKDKKENYAEGFNIDWSNEYYKYSGTTDTQENNKITNNTAFIRNIFINLEYFKQKFTSVDNLYDAILSIFKGINSACANVWDFKIGTSPDHSRYYVCDASYMNSVDLNDKKIFLFNTREIKIDDNTIYPGIIKSLSIDTMMSNDISMNAFYGANKSNKDATIENGLNDTSVNLFDKKYKDSFIKTIEDKIEEIEIRDYQSDATDNSSAVKNTLPSDVRQYYSLDAVKYSDQLKHYLPVYPQYSQDYKKYWFIDGMKRLLTCDPSDTVKTTLSNILLPIKVRLTIEGISGIKIGDCFHVDCLPDRYKERGLFQIIELKHMLDKEGWFTEFRGIYRVLGRKGGKLPEGKPWSDPYNKINYIGIYYQGYEPNGVGNNEIGVGERTTSGNTVSLDTAIPKYKDQVLEGIKLAIEYQKDRDRNGKRHYGNTIDNLEVIYNELLSTKDWTVKSTLAYRIMFWINSESGWNPQRINYIKCCGLFQLNSKNERRADGSISYIYRPKDDNINYLSAFEIAYMSVKDQIKIVSAGSLHFNKEDIMKLTGGFGSQVSYPRKGWYW